jgi:hypothetical protein
VLLYWQLAPSAHDLSASVGDPSVNASYYEPLAAELRRVDGGRPTRIEVPLMKSHWEAAYLPKGELLLARGWDRQLDTHYARLFYRARLGPAAYRAWLNENAVSYVALPDARLDGAGRLEAKLIESGTPFLHAIWHSPHWRLFAVWRPQSLAQPPARLSTIGTDSFTLWAPRTGRYEMRVRFNPYWAIVSGRGCVNSAGGWTDVQARAPGSIRVAVDFSPERIFDHGTRCN